MKNSYTLAFLDYPGLFAIKPKTWIRFDNEKHQYAFQINETRKGLVVYEPYNELVMKSGEHVLKNHIKDPRGSRVNLTSNTSSLTMLYKSVAERGHEHLRSYIEKPYTRLWLLIEGFHETKGYAFYEPYLNSLFLLYNSTMLDSTVLKPSMKYFQESINIFVANFEHEATFEEVMQREDIKWNTKFIVKFTFVKFSTDVVNQNFDSFVRTNKELRNIPKGYENVFELFTSAVMQLNHFKNFKLAIIEAFVAVEILIIQVSEVSLIGKMNRARTIRNDIMHSNKIAEEKEISELVKLTRGFLFMIIEKYESKFSQTVS